VRVASNRRFCRDPTRVLPTLHHPSITSRVKRQDPRTGFPPRQTCDLAALDEWSLARASRCEQIQGTSFSIIEPRLANIPAQLAEALRDCYVLERALGRGGMATVYLARDVKHDRHAPDASVPGRPHVSRNRRQRSLL